MRTMARSSILTVFTTGLCFHLHLWSVKSLGPVNTCRYAASYGDCQEPRGDSGCSGAAPGSCGFQLNHNVRCIALILQSPCISSSQCPSFPIVVSLFTSTDLQIWENQGYSHFPLSPFAAAFLVTSECFAGMCCKCRTLIFPTLSSSAPKCPKFYLLSYVQTCNCTSGCFQPKKRLFRHVVQLDRSRRLQQKFLRDAHFSESSWSIPVSQQASSNGQ